MKIKVLFVDDDAFILQGLRRMLRTMRSEWDMCFSQGGKAALDLMAEQPFDVIVTDMTMPDMDGAQLLEQTAKLYPETIRIVLSGQSSNEVFFKSIGSAHQFISKPATDTTLKQAIQRAHTLKNLLQNENIGKLITKMESIPSLPTLYTDLLKELESPEPSMQLVGDIIEKDVGMSAKILQVVNSAFYGVRQNISRPSKAVLLLGLENIRSLVLMVHVFSKIDKSQLPSGFSAESVWNHSAEVSNFARMIAHAQNSKDQSSYDAQSAGLLHDVGKLILAHNLSDQYGWALHIAEKKNISVCQSEMKFVGATHAEVGAYLLGLWGLPNNIVEAVAFHHNPAARRQEVFSTVTAVHVANAFALGDESLIDIDYLKALGLDNRLEFWRDTCKNTALEDMED